MPDAELAQALKLAKSKPMFFAFLPKLPGGKLFVSKNKVPMKDILQAKKDLAAGTPVTGTCFGPLDNMVFKVGKPVAGAYENVIPQIVKHEAGLRRRK